MAGIRSFVHVLGVSALVLLPSAFAQAQTGERGVFRTLEQALETGLFDRMPPAAEPGIEPGGAGSVDACVMDASCVQPSDSVTGFNVANFSAAETVTILESGTLSRFCAKFIFAPGGACPVSATDPSLTLGWTLDFFDVLPGGDVDESTLVAYDTDVLVNMNVTVSDGGPFGGAFRFVNVRMDMAAGGGVPVTTGQTIAINPQWRGFGGACGNFFWASSSNIADGSATGDGLFLFDQTSQDNWSDCEYNESDLTVCLDVLAGPPTTTPDFEMPISNDECDTPLFLACDTVNAQCLRFATSNSMDDPAFACETSAGIDPTFTGTNTVWYSVTPETNRIQIDTCASDSGANFLLQVFRAADVPGSGVGPCDLVLVRCSDNDCTDGALVCLNDAVPGEELVVQVAAASPDDVVDVTLTVTCDVSLLPPAPGNDLCANATPLFSTPMPKPDELIFAQGDTRCASLDPIATACGTTVNGISPGVWFTAVGDGTLWQIVINMEGGFDSQLNVYCGGCETGLVCIAGNNDSTTSPPSAALVFCAELGTRYYIYCHGFNATGEFDLSGQTNFLNAGPCTDPTNQGACPMLCPGDCNGDGNVNFGDLVATLFEFGTPDSSSDCDADGSGAVNFADLVAALFLFGPCP